MSTMHLEIGSEKTTSGSERGCPPPTEGATKTEKNTFHGYVMNHKSKPQTGSPAAGGGAMG